MTAGTRKRIRKPRGKGLRTRTGCLACRSRHIKCPEEKPRCRRCDIAGRQCTYEEQPPGEPGPDHVQRDLEDNNPNDEAREGREAPGSELPPLLDAAPQTPFTPFPANPFPLDLNVLDTSPESSWGTPPGYTAEVAGLSWLNLLTTDAANASPALPHGSQAGRSHPDLLSDHVDRDLSNLALVHPEPVDLYISDEDVSLSREAIALFQHFVQHLSTWIDLTDPDRSFAVVVPSMALRNAGLMKAILALSARHQSLKPSNAAESSVPIDRTLSVKYYSETLQYLQKAMENKSYLRSDHLLATVLVISTYEMIDGCGNGWERHLKGVFWIQRSQLIHGESEGLKKCIWWAWLRQDIWAAFKERRKILSYYSLKRPCSELDFWELANRSCFLLGQCVNYASEKEVEAGRYDVQSRVEKGQMLWDSLEEWRRCFAQHDRRLPALPTENTMFQPIWINPPAASAAVQVHHFAKILLLDMMPATGGLKDLTSRKADVEACTQVVCGIALCTRDDAAMITSTQCLLAVRELVDTAEQRQAIDDMLQSHQEQTRWPNDRAATDDFGRFVRSGIT